MLPLLKLKKKEKKKQDWNKQYITIQKKVYIQDKASSKTLKNTHF